MFRSLQDWQDFLLAGGVCVCVCVCVGVGGMELYQQAWEPKEGFNL